MIKEINVSKRLPGEAPGHADALIRALEQIELDSVSGGGSKLGSGTDGLDVLDSKPSTGTDGVMPLGSKPGGVGDGVV
jgi:hypothetical protein